MSQRSHLNSLPRFPDRCRVCCGGLPRAHRAWPLAWPSPSGPPGRQRLRAQGWVPKMLSAERSERIFGCPCGWRGRLGQCAAFRPGDCDLRTAMGALRASVTAWPAHSARHRGRYGGDWLRPVPGKLCAAAAAPVGLPPGRARAKLPPRNGETPATLAACGQLSRPLYSPSVARACSRSRSRPSGLARRRCALDDVKKVLADQRRTLARGGLLAVSVVTKDQRQTTNPQVGDLLAAQRG